MTHQGSLCSTDTLIVAVISSQATTQGTHVDIASIQPPPQPRSMPRAALSAAHTRAHVRWHAHRMARSAHMVVLVKSVLGELHHEYSLAPTIA